MTCNSTAQHSTAQHSTAQHNILYLKTGSLSAVFRSFFECLFVAPRVILFHACILISALIPHTAYAALDCTIKSAQLTSGHSTIYLTPSANPAIGDFVGVNNLFKIIYRCKVSGTPTHWTSAERIVPSIIDTGLLKDWSHAADIYSLLTNPQLQQFGLGFSGFFFHENDWPATSRHLTGIDQWGGLVWTELPPADSDGYVELGITVHYRFSKINESLIVSDTPVTMPLAQIPLAAFLIHDNEASGTQDWSPIAHATLTMPTLTIAQRACTPFTNTVKLPVVNTDDLNAINIGDSLSPTDFWIEMRCPSYVGGIGYYVTPVHGFENEMQGVIKINPASTAKGIGLQITTRNVPAQFYLTSDTTTSYHPIQFGQTNNYFVYSSLPFGAGTNIDPLSHETDHTAPDNTIPLRVAVYRTGTVVPGTYNAAIFIHLVYR